MFDSDGSQWLWQSHSIWRWCQVWVIFPPKAADGDEGAASGAAWLGPRVCSHYLMYSVIRSSHCQQLYRWVLMNHRNPKFVSIWLWGQGFMYDHSGVFLAWTWELFLTQEVLKCSNYSQSKNLHLTTRAHVPKHLRLILGSFRGHPASVLTTLDSLVIAFF